MLAQVQSCAVIGLDAEPVRVEIDIASGLERVTLVGLPDAAVRESSERVRAAVSNSGYFFPQHRLTINLAPADLRKEGPAYDLPIAVGILAAARQIPHELNGSLIVGELGLDGEVRPINGVLPMASMAQRREIKQMFVPALNASEAALVEGVEVYPIATLSELVGHLTGVQPIARYETRFTSTKMKRSSFPSTSKTSRGRNWPSAPWRSPAPVPTTASCPARPAPARRYWPARCPRSCPGSP